MRSFLALLTSLVPLSCSAAYLVPDYLGEWDQVYSNLFVQSSTEIDLKCIKVNLSTTGFNATLISKSASLHGTAVQFQSLPEPVLQFSDTTWLIGTDMYLVRAGAPASHVVLTGTDDITLLVWARNRTAFLDSPTNEYVLEDLVRWNYTDQYKSPILCPCADNVLKAEKEHQKARAVRGTIP